MIKVEYTLSKEALKKIYIREIYPHVSASEGRWTPIRDRLEAASGSHNIFPDTIEKILEADFNVLNVIYQKYTELRKTGRVSVDDHNELKTIFPYSSDNMAVSIQPYISKFFMDPHNGFVIHTCHYCDMAYVNVYDALAGYNDVLELVNNASEEELQSLIRTAGGDCISKKTVKTILNNRKYRTEDAFNELGVWHGRQMCDEIRKDLHNHFDLDHVLPKSECPIIGLSLFNFVPSCQVCNEKLKRRKALGDSESMRLKLSPTNDGYQFDEKVKIVVKRKDGLIPKINSMGHADEYRLEFEYDDKDYAKSVNLFRLSERYNYHIIEALRLHDLLMDYNEYIGMLHRMFKEKGLGAVYTMDKIKEDIFAENYYQVFHRCFGKMHKDIIDRYRKDAKVKKT